MCDYSLHNVASRPVKVGDRLVTTEFSNTNTRGFSAVGEPGTAVCLIPGTEIAFEHPVRRVLTGFLMAFSKRSWEPMAHKVAQFRQANMDNPHTHHDALEFPDGRVVLLTHLRAGQRATVLQLPVHAQSQIGAITNGNNDRPVERIS